MNIIGRTLIFTGLVILIMGILLVIGANLPIRLGRLPGDIHIEWKNGSFYFPIVTSIIISLVLTILLNLLFFLSNFFNR